MKKFKRKIKKIKRKYDNRLKHFWDFSINPISGLPPVINIGGGNSIAIHTTKKINQRTYYKPKGFR